MTDRILRPATDADHEALLDVWARAVRATHDFLTPADIDELHPLVAQALRDGAMEVWVVVAADGTAIGWMGLAGSHVEALFVAPEARGTGAGRQCIEHAQARAPTAALTVDVNEQNPAAAGFYRRLGFVQVGRSPLDSTGRPFPILHLRRPAPDPRGDRSP